MATALPHAPPTKAAFPHAKLPAPLVPLKGTARAEVPSHVQKSQFQSLLDKLAPPTSPKKAQVVEATPTPQVVKPKVAEAPVEKPKEPKKSEVKAAKDQGKGEDVDHGWGVGMQVAVKTDPAPKAAKPEAEAVPTATDKAKTAKPDKKAGVDVGILVGGATAGEAKAAPATGPTAKADRTEEKPKVFVVDRRSDKEKEKLKLPGAETSALQPVSAGADVASQPKVTDPKANNDVQIAFQPAGHKAADGFELNPQSAPVPPRDAASFQQYLVDRGYGQLVDQARIVLKDQNAGEIRMTLYPETLGKVKVALNLTDSSLAGQIFVENQTVKDVFQSNMDGLIQAFRDGGWNDLSLQVSVGNGNTGGQSGQQNPSPPVPQSRDYDRQVTQVIADSRADRIGSWNDRQVNLTA